MSTLYADQSAAPLPPVTPKAARRMGTAGRVVFGMILGFVLLSLTRQVSGVEGLTSGGTFGAVISDAMPIALAGLGGLWSERSGVVNIGLEGMMILGTFFGAMFAYFSGSPWLGVVGGIVGGLLGGLVHAVATVTFGVDQVISGVAITILSTGLARYLAGVFFANEPGGGPTQSPSIPTFDALKIPGAQSGLTSLEKHHWFVISDLAGLLRAITTTLTPLTIIMILLFPLSWFLLWRTAFGLRLRMCGENPTAAESRGVPVYRLKYIAVIVSGVLAGLAGSFLADFTGIYHEGQTGGRGYIGLAAMIFGNWRPGGLAAGAGLFGFTDAVQLRQGGQGVHSLLLLIVFALALIALFFVFRKRWLVAVVAVVIGVGVGLWYGFTGELPIEFVPYTPYVITLLVLALASQRLRPPAMDGIPWRRGQGA